MLITVLTGPPPLCTSGKTTSKLRLCVRVCVCVRVCPCVCACVQQLFSDSYQEHYPFLQHHLFPHSSAAQTSLGHFWRLVRQQQRRRRRIYYPGCIIHGGMLGGALARSNVQPFVCSLSPLSSCRWSIFQHLRRRQVEADGATLAAVQKSFLILER